MFQKKNIFAIGALLAGAAIILLFTSITVTEQQGKSAVQTTLVLETETLPLLEPHEHENFSDSIFDVDHGVLVNSPTLIVEESVWVTDIKLIMNGAPQDVLHHALILEKKHMNPVCSNVERELAAFGLETPTSLTFPEPYGIPLAPGDVLELQTMLHNSADNIEDRTTYRDVSVRVELTVEESNERRVKPLEVYHISLIDTLCSQGFDNATFTVPPNTLSFTRSSDETDAPNPSQYTFTSPGTILVVGGHFHAWEGGELLNIFLDNEIIRTFRSAKTKTGDWTYYITPQPTAPVPVHAGQEITLEAVYSNPSEYTVRGAMGMTVLYFAPDDPNDIHLELFRK